MRINSIEQNYDRCHFDVTFKTESKEWKFLKNLTEYFIDVFPINCLIRDLDTSFSIYKEFFPRNNYFIFDEGTYISILAFEINKQEIYQVISNWGYYTLDAILFFGNLKKEYTLQEIKYGRGLKDIHIIVEQVLDTSLNITADLCFTKQIQNLIFELK